jgi:hypothetical protein
MQFNDSRKAAGSFYRLSNVGQGYAFDSPRAISESLRAAVPSYRQTLPAYVRISTAGGVYCVPASAFL